MALTYEPIATTTISSPTSTITFSSIPSSYTDLVVVVTGKITGTTEDAYFRLNNDSGANYYWLIGRANAQGTLNVASPGSATTQLSMGDVMTDSACITTWIVNNYSASGVKKVIYQGNKHRNTLTAGEARVYQGVGHWQTGGVVNRVDLLNGASTTTGRWDAGTIATIYGILKA